MRNFTRSLTSCFLIAGLALSGAALAEGTKKKPKKPAAKKKGATTEEAAPTEEGATGTPAATPPKGGAAAHAAGMTHYGMAGCGLGSLIIKDHQGKLSQFIASLLNGTGMQSSAITLGTSNCVSGKAEGGEAVAIYVKDNFETLAKEASQGAGSSLAGLATIMGCQDHKAFSEVSQRRFEDLYQVNSPDEVVVRYSDVIADEPQLAQTCPTVQVL